MSFDDDYDGGVNAGAFIAIMGLIVIMLVCVVSLANDGAFDSNIQHKQRQILINQTKIILNNPNLTCGQISELRLESIHANSTLYNPLFDSENQDTARDLWNAKGCGAHWGWFEK